MLKKVVIGAVSLILLVAIYADSLPTPEQNDNRASAENTSKQGFGALLFGGKPSDADSQSNDIPATDEGVVQIRTADDVAQQDYVEPAPNDGDGTFGQPMVSTAPTLPSNQTDSDQMVNGEIPSDSEF